MSIFGQVWLWSVAAFLVGVLLTWLVLVRPAQARVRLLERRLLAAQTARAPERSAALPPRVFEPLPGLEPDAFLPPLELEPAPVVAFQPALVKEHPEPIWFDRESFGEPVAPDEDEAEPARVEPLAAEFAYPSSVLEPECETEAGSTSLSNADNENPAENLVEDEGSDRGSLFAASGIREPEFTSFSEREAEPAPPAYAFSSDVAPGGDESPVEATHLLPRRQPGHTSRTAFDAPQPVQPSVRAIERREPVPADEGGRSGSLFEPTVRPNSGGARAVEADAPPTPPPAPRAADSSVPPGPFGPGSAMPRPGGGRPSDDFAVKASVTALRYCTEDSPQYSRMVAEVWFRSAADAERVGFRRLA